MDKLLNPPAFPARGQLLKIGDRMIQDADQPGMTLRDYFADTALRSLIAANSGDADLADATSRLAMEKKQTVAELLAGASYSYADAMLKERAK